MTEATPYPMDFGDIKKGDYICAATCKDIIKEMPGTTAYQLKLLGLAKRIEAECGKLGIAITVKQEKDGIRVLTDAEASEYNLSQINVHVQGIRRRAGQLSGVDASELTTEQTKEHHRRLVRAGFFVSALQLGSKQANKALKEEHKKQLEKPE